MTWLVSAGTAGDTKITDGWLLVPIEVDQLPIIVRMHPTIDNRKIDLKTTVTVSLPKEKDNPSS